MRIRKSVVIVDNEPPLCATLKRMFEMSREFDFRVTTSTSLDDCKLILSVDPDILIIDLDLENRRDPADFQGFLLLLSRSELRDAEIRIVYTAYPEAKNAIKAMRLGATDFVAKQEWTPAELVERVEATLHYNDERCREQRLIYRFIATNQINWKDKPSEYLAIGVDLDNKTPEVVAAGQSRLEAILNYNKDRIKGDRRFSHLPHIHFVSGAET